MISLRFAAAVSTSLALLSTACATPAGAPTERPDRVVTGLGTSTGSGTGSRTGTLGFTTDEGYESAELPTSAADAWAALLKTYEELELPLAEVDTEAHIVGNPTLPAPRRIAGLRMSRLFRCGDTMTGPLADAARITIDIETRLDDVETGGLVSTYVRATAVPNDGGGTPRPCQTTGRLESEIHEALLKNLLVGGPAELD